MWTLPIDIWSSEFMETRPLSLEGVVEFFDPVVVFRLLGYAAPGSLGGKYSHAPLVW